MNLEKITKALRSIAPLNLAESWDNVGLLVEPSPPHQVKTIMLTNDLTEGVLKEAIDHKVGLIVSYHPPIFQPLKRLVWNNPKQRIVSLAIENRIAIYSPHTSCDAVENGVNDWLSKSLGHLHLSHPIKPRDGDDSFNFVITSGVGGDFHKSFHRCIARNYASAQIANGTCTLSCASSEVPKLMNVIAKNCVEMKDIRINATKAGRKPLDGMGRVCLLSENTTLEELLGRIKYHIRVPNLRVAVGEGKTLTSPLKSAALCAGSGASILGGMKSDLFLTGEMSHHEVLAATANGTSVVLCEHSNSERGYLRVLKDDMHKQLDDDSVEIILSKVDRDPLTVM